MDRQKETRLRKAGWKVGSAEEFLELSPDEVALVEVKLALSEKLREQRADQGLTQTELAKRLRSSQSRVAKMEASDPTASVDLLLRGLFAAGASRAEVAGVIGKKRRPASRNKARGNSAK
ncbi:MAG: helix-turn-helix transcriptional regulator [Gemmatimonadota bacterium]